MQDLEVLEKEEPNYRMFTDILSRLIIRNTVLGNRRHAVDGTANNVHEMKATAAVANYTTLSEDDASISSSHFSSQVQPSSAATATASTQKSVQFQDEEDESDGGATAVAAAAGRLERNFPSASNVNFMLLCSIECRTVGPKWFFFVHG